MAWEVSSQLLLPCLRALGPLTLLALPFIPGPLALFSPNLLSAPTVSLTEISSSVVEDPPDWASLKLSLKFAFTFIFIFSSNSFERRAASAPRSAEMRDIFSPRSLPR